MLPDFLMSTYKEIDGPFDFQPQNIFFSSRSIDIIPVVLSRRTKYTIMPEEIILMSKMASKCTAYYRSLLI